MPFLFDPDRVERLLGVLPETAKALPAPTDEGRPSVAFKGLRVTDRALYRLLANPHYPHLRETLRAIECVAASGISWKELRNATLSSEFGSFLSEVLAADHLLVRGAQVTKPTQAGRPDLEVSKDDFAASVEVYSPRSWQARADWLQDVTDSLKNADIGFDFQATVDVTSEEAISAEGLEDVILRTGARVLDELARDIAALSDESDRRIFRYSHEPSGLATVIEFHDIQPSAPEGPARLLAISGPGHAYTAPQVFDELIAKVTEKAGKNQAAKGGGKNQGLFVSCDRTGLDQFELWHGRGSFEDALARLPFDDLGLDFVAFTLPKRRQGGPRRGLVAVKVLFESERISRDEIALLFDLPPEDDSISP